MSWLDRSWSIIDAVHASLPPDATYEQRKQALFDAYPFGERRYDPYKQWGKAKREYLARYAPHKTLDAAFWERQKGRLRHAR